MANQPQWKLLYSTDDEALYIDETGQHDPELAIAEEYETERGTTRCYVYRFPLPRLKLVEVEEEDRTISRYLVPYIYKESWTHPVSAYEEWFIADLDSVAESCGTTRAVLVDALCSERANVRAQAYRDIASYHGLDNFNSQPSDWTESEIKDWPDRGKPEVKISTNDDDDGRVTLYLHDVEAARDARSVLGSLWEINEGLAYTSVDDRKDLVKALEAEGYEVDDSEWSPPDDEDFRFWHAKYESANGATPERLREILCWRSLEDVRVTRRVEDQIRSWTDEQCEAYVVECYGVGFVLDGERWIKERAA